MVHKSVWTGWSDAASVRSSHAENESDHFYEAQVWRLSPSHAASEPIRAAAHAPHSISAGLELIKLSISDNPCLYILLVIQSVLLPLLFSLCFPLSSWLWFLEWEHGCWHCGTPSARMPKLWKMNHIPENALINEYFFFSPHFAYWLDTPLVFYLSASFHLCSADTHKQ